MQLLAAAGRSKPMGIIEKKAKWGM
jgi:hypothetical protein